MNKYFKLLTTVMLLLAVISTPASLVEADGDDLFELTEVTIEGVDFEVNGGYELGTYAPVYLNSEVDVEVEWEGLADVDDEEFEAKISLEFDGDDVDTEYFDVGENHHGRSTLTVEIEDDLLDDDESSRLVPLYIKMRTRDGDFDQEVKVLLKVTREKNLVEIYDVNFRQGTQLEAGQLMTASVGIVNDGREEEEDIYVRMSIPELGLTTRSDRFDLVPEDEEDVDNEEYFKLHKTLFLELPLNTPSGVYDVHFEVVYDDGDEKDEQVYSMVVGAGTAFDSQISIDTESLTTGAGKAIVYTLSFGNPNANYDVEVEGVDFGTVKVTEEGDTAFVFVSVDEDAKVGSYDFKIMVKSGNNVLEEFDVTTEVVEGKSDVNYSDVKQGLEIGFAVLLVILVILGIILVAKKLGKGDELEEPVLDEDQTYY